MVARVAGVGTGGGSQHEGGASGGSRWEGGIGGGDSREGDVGGGGRRDQTLWTGRIGWDGGVV